MHLLSRLLSPVQLTALDPTDDRYYTAISGGPALTGLYVTPEVALKISAVWACVRVISDPLGWLPLHMYKRQVDGGRQRATWHPLYSLLHDQPNAWQTALEWRKMMTAYALLRGDGLSRIVSGPRGAVDQLLPIHPDRVQLIEQMPDYTLRYTIRKFGSLTNTETLLGDEVFHLRFATFDGLRGASVIEYARETLGLGLATEQYAARFFSQNATPAGLLKHPGKVDKAGREKIKAEWEQAIGGLGNAHRTAVVAEGIDYTPVSVSHEDAQFLETREFGVEEIARWFGVPLHKIQSQSKTTSWGSGVEEMNQDFVSQTLAPLATAWQQAISRDLILDTRNYYAEFLFDALSKGRMLDRYQAFHLALTDGWLNRNEVRQIENHNRAEGLDEFLYAANMTGMDEEPAAEPEPGVPPQEAEPPAPETPDAAEEARGAAQRLAASVAIWLAENAETAGRAHYRALLIETAGRIVRKEVRALDSAARRNGRGSAAWAKAIHEFYVEHAPFVAQALRLPLATAAQYVARQEAAAQQDMLDETAAVAWLCTLAEGADDV